MTFTGFNSNSILTTPASIIKPFQPSMTSSPIVAFEVLKCYVPRMCRDLNSDSFFRFHLVFFILSWTWYGHSFWLTVAPLTRSEVYLISLLCSKKLVYIPKIQTSIPWRPLYYRYWRAFFLMLGTLNPDMLLCMIMQNICHLWKMFSRLHILNHYPTPECEQEFTSASTKFD